MSKRAADLLNKDFPEKSRLEIKTRTSNGVSFDASITKNQDDTIIGTLNPKFVPTVAGFSRHGVTVGADMDTNRNVKLHAEAANLVSGLTTKITGDTRNDIVTLDNTYRHDYFTATSSVDFFNPKGTNALIGATVGMDGFALGVNTRYQNNGITALNASVAYNAVDYAATLYSQLKQNIVGINYYQRVNPRTSIAADASFDLSHDSTANKPKLTIGGRYEVDVLSASFVKTKFDTEGRLAVSYGQRLNAFASLTVGGTFNTNSFNKAGGHNFGFTLALND